VADAVCTYFDGDRRRGHRLYFYYVQRRIESPLLPLCYFVSSSALIYRLNPDHPFGRRLYPLRPLLRGARRSRFECGRCFALNLFVIPTFFLFFISSLCPFARGQSVRIFSLLNAQRVSVRMFFIVALSQCITPFVCSFDGPF